jgi:hypothetical protein
VSDWQEWDWAKLRQLGSIKRDDAFFRRNTFDKERASKLLVDIAIHCQLGSEHLEAIMAIEHALSGIHPYMSAELRPVPEGTTPRPLMEVRRGALAKAVADFIDMQVAQGVKQESIIQEVIDETGISRREIFRMLKTYRRHRAYLKKEGGPTNGRPWFEGFDINDDGTLVPTRSTN